MLFSQGVSRTKEKVPSWPVPLSERLEQASPFYEKTPKLLTHIRTVLANVRTKLYDLYTTQLTVMNKQD